MEDNSLEYPAWSAPAAIKRAGYLYVRGKDRLVCFNLRSETK